MTDARPGGSSEAATARVEAEWGVAERGVATTSMAVVGLVAVVT